MRLKLTRWDSSSGNYAINDATNYEAVIQPGNSMPPATANFIDLGQGNPILAGKTLSGGYFTFVILLRGNVETQRDELNKWFRPSDFTFRKLLAEDLDNSNKEWYLEGYPVTPPMLADGIAKYSITLALKSPFWIEDDLNTDTWNIAASTDTNVIAAIGNTPALPTFEITPGGAKGSNDLRYKRFVAVYPGTTMWAAEQMPVNLTNNGWDTAALVTATKMQADGDDVVVSVNGVNVDRWFGGGGINSATTGVWCNLDFRYTPAMTLAVALDNSTTPATLTTNITSLAFLPTLQQNSTLLIGTELFSYSTAVINVQARTVAFTLVERDAKDSTIAAHSIGDAVYIIENEIWIAYGNSSATAPTVNDDYKPDFNLSTSTNSSWVFATFGTPTRVGRNGRFYQNGSRQYVGDREVYSDPYAAIGCKLYSSLVGNVVVSDTIGSGSWIISHPGGFSQMVIAGEKYRSGTTWCEFVRIYSLTKPIVVFNNIATPTLAATWQAISETLTLTNNPEGVLFQMKGGLGTSFPAPTAQAELQSVTMTLYRPAVAAFVSAEKDNYIMNGSLTNSTTVEGFVFNNMLAKTGLKITINCEDQEVYSADGARIRGMLSFSGAARDEWMTLTPGNNTLAWSDTGTTDLVVVTKWRSRNTI